MVEVSYCPKCGKLLETTHGQCSWCGWSKVHTNIVGPYYYSNNFEQPASGWLCPRCGIIYSPLIERYPQCLPPVKTSADQEYPTTESVSTSDLLKEMTWTILYGPSEKRSTDGNG